MLRKMILARSGIQLGEDRKTFLQIRVEERMRARKLSSVVEYCRFLSTDLSGREETELLVDSVTTKETWFFRETEPLKAWYQSAAPDLFQPGNTIRIWSAACSTGEEPYTIAMLLADAFPGYGRPTLEILGTDLSTTAVASGQAGVYDSHSLRHTSEYWRNKYFQEIRPGKWSVADDIRRRVRFAQTNLLSPSPAYCVGLMDLAVCRNVLIYFDAESRQTTLRNLYSALKPGGFLLLGFSETIAFNNSQFEVVSVNGSILYRKPKRFPF